MIGVEKKGFLKYIIVQRVHRVIPHEGLDAYMKRLTPQIIAGITGGKYIGKESSRDDCVTGVVRDDRDVEKGNLFVCIQGTRSDGHSFANKAFESGAACCLAEHMIPDAKGPYVLVKSTLESIKTLGGHYRSLFDIPVIGITGSVGKTSVKELVAAALGAKLNVLKTPGNLNNELGVPLTLLSLDEQYEAAVIEMGISDFGEMGRLAEIVRPDIFVMTKIGYSHIKELGDLNGVLRAKSEAFAFMKPEGIAVMNGDDDLLWKYDPGMRKITFGLDMRNDYRAENVRSEGTESVLCDIVHDAAGFQVRIPAYGSHLASLAPAAAAIGRLLGLTDAEISRGLLSYAPVGGRCNVSHSGGITLIDDCYNANPNSVKAALASLCDLRAGAGRHAGRYVAILGDMLNLSEFSEQMHYETGILAAQSGVGLLICCGAEAAFIHKGFLSAGGKTAHFFPDKAQLVAALPGMLRKGDTILVKASRGMRFEELLPFIYQLLSETTG